MYRQQLSQAPEPAVASPAAIQQAAMAQARAAESLTGFAGSMFKGYVEGQIDLIGVEAEKFTQEFLIKNQAAEKAVEQAAEIQQQRTLFDKLNEGPRQTLEEQQQFQQQLSSFDNEVNRLKLAAEGGMSNKQYISRINTLTRNAIAKYPGLANEIRQKVSSSTGLEGAEQWAAKQFVKERFSTAKGKETKTERDFAIADTARVAPLGTFGSQLDLMNLYDNDRPEYYRRMNAANKVFKIETETKLLKDKLSAEQNVSDQQADTMRPAFTGVFSSTFASSVVAKEAVSKETVYKQVLDLMAKGENIIVNPKAFEVQIKMHVAQMRDIINNAKVQAEEFFNKWAGTQQISDAKRNEIRKDIDRASEVAMAKYGDEKGIGLIAMANIMSVYRDKSLQEQVQLVDLAIKHQSAMQNNPLVSAYWAGKESRENLKRTHPQFYEFMVGQERDLTSSIMGVRNEIQGATDLANVQRVITQAQQDSKAIPVDPNVDPKIIKATHQALMSSSMEVLKKSELTAQEINTVSAALSTNTVTGANSLILQREYKQLGVKISKLPESDQAVIKSNVSNSISNAVTNVTSIKNVIEAKYKFPITLGVNDAGEISVIAPSASAFKTTGTMEARQRAMREYPKAAEEFMKQAKPVLNNMVYGKAMLTMETPKQVGSEFASIINGGQTYTGFFSMEAKPVAEQASARKIDVEAMSPSISPVQQTDVNKPLTPTEVVVGGATPTTSTQKANEQTTTPVRGNVILNSLRELKPQ